MADQKTGDSGERGQGESSSSSPEQPRSPDSKSLNSDHEYIMLATPDVESDSGSGVSVCKSQGSSVSSFADVIIPDMEATLEKGPTEEELRHLVEDAKKDISHSSASVQEVFSSQGTENEVQKAFLNNDDPVAANGNIEQIPGENDCHVLNPCVVEDDSQTEDDNVPGNLVRQRSSSDEKTNTTQASNVAQFNTGETVRPRASTHPGHSDDEGDDNAVLFDGITYLGSSTVNAPVSEIELKRTMSILREQTEVTIDVLLYVGSTSDGMIKLKDPETQADIATYRVQRILFCGRGDVDGSESDCFAFNTVHGDSDIFHCHVFRCKDPEKVQSIPCHTYITVENIYIPSTEGFFVFPPPLWKFCFNFILSFESFCCKPP